MIDGSFYASGRDSAPNAGTVTPQTQASSGSDDFLETSDGFAQMLVPSGVDYAMCSLDLDGNVTSWNARAQRIKGYSAQEISGSHFSVFYTNDDVRAGEPARSLEIARTTGRFEAEGWRVRKDGTRLWASVAIDACATLRARLSVLQRSPAT